MIRRSGLPAVRLAAAAAGAAAVLVAVLTGWGTPAWWAVPLLAIAVAGAEVAVVSLQFGRQRWQFSLTEAALAAALVLAPGAWPVLPVAIGVAAAQLARRQPPVKTAFNVAQFSLAAAGASAVSTALGAGTPGALGGLAVFFLLNHALVALAVSLTSERRFSLLVLASAPLSALHTAGNSSLGLLAAHLVESDPVGLLGLVVPMALLWSSYDQQTRRSTESRLFAELARGSEHLVRSPDASARVVLTAAARLLGADVELLLRAPEGTVRYRGDEDGVLQRRAVDASAFDDPCVVRALGSRGVSSGAGADGAWCAAVLGESPLAVLVARRDAGSSSFSRSDLRAAAVLVGQAGAWLSVADLAVQRQAAAEQADVADQAARALGDVGAETAPALVLLRDSAERLARLAATSGEIAPVVEELQLVERAVASLLGAVALAAEPDLVRGVPVPREVPARPAAEWTSTGTFP